jgi:hypothetical protein
MPLRVVGLAARPKHSVLAYVNGREKVATVTYEIQSPTNWVKLKGVPGLLRASIWVWR